jgi:hypothetical protein
MVENVITAYAIISLPLGLLAAWPLKIFRRTRLTGLGLDGRVCAV